MAENPAYYRERAREQHAAVATRLDTLRHNLTHLLNHGAGTRSVRRADTDGAQRPRFTSRCRQERR
ncbi:hypothetical protein FHT02_001157 [Sphingomonas xinjiangensis]|uniref:Uncharacterized protein n=1 Tax=Sphingomonas xinjiangensis TaxID=643568 RepID=A0A840YCB4_9SPHN|nr:hypothetical protein [Sphingomonas xinjiangensis]